MKYNVNAYTPNANVVTAKIIFYSIVSTMQAKFLCVKLKYFYLGTPLTHPE